MNTYGLLRSARNDCLSFEALLLMIDFQKLVILHCKLNKLDADEGCKPRKYFKQISGRLFSFRPESCARQVFIFYNLSASDMEFLISIKNQLEQVTNECDLLIGMNAYQFFLHWSVGLLSKVNQHNDRFVLGKIRDHWTTFCVNDAKDLQGQGLLSIMPELLSDARAIRRMIETDFYRMSNEDRISATLLICKQYYSMREKNISPHGRDLQFLSGVTMDACLSPETIKKEQQRLSKRLRSIQEQVEALRATSVVCQPETKQERVMLGLTQAAISTALQKHRLEHLFADMAAQSEICKPGA